MKTPLDPAALQATLLQQMGWRTRPGILGQHAASPQSIHALLGYFLNDRDSPTPFPGRDMLVDSSLFDWGVAPPLEKVIRSRLELDLLLGLPEIYRHSVAVIEPWRNVGLNLDGEEVRASKNIAYILQQVADADTILFPIWESGVANVKRLASVLDAGIATVIQGGNPSVHDPASFNGANASLEDILGLTDELLLHRSPGSGPSIFICLGHQLAAASHIRLIKRAVREVAELVRLPLDPERTAIASLQRVCQRIAEVGAALPVIKRRPDPRPRLARHPVRGGAQRAGGGGHPPPAALPPAQRQRPHSRGAARGPRAGGRRTRGRDRHHAEDWSANCASRCSTATRSTKRRPCSPTGPSSCCTTPSCRSATRSPSAPCPGC